MPGCKVLCSPVATGIPLRHSSTANHQKQGSLPVNGPDRCTDVSVSEPTTNILPAAAVGGTSPAQCCKEDPLLYPKPLAPTGVLSPVLCLWKGPAKVTQETLLCLFCTYVCNCPCVSTWACVHINYGSQRSTPGPSAITLDLFIYLYFGFSR